MPIYTPKTTTTEFKGGKNILASEHLQYIEAGATLDGSAFEKGYHEAGTLICRNLDTGKYVPYEEDTTGETPAIPENYDNFGITDISFEVDGDYDLVIGQVIVRGSVYEEKLADTVPTTFKEANPLIRYTSHV